MFLRCQNPGAVTEHPRVRSNLTRIRSSRTPYTRRFASTKWQYFAHQTPSAYVWLGARSPGAGLLAPALGLSARLGLTASGAANAQ